MEDLKDLNKRLMRVYQAVGSFLMPNGKGGGACGPTRKETKTYSN